MTRRHVRCPYCDRDAELVGGGEIYPHRDDLTHKKFWRCKPCKAWVGCHPDTTKPLGRLANAELRREKQKAHAASDPLWRSKEMSRTGAYRWLAAQLGIAEANCHIGMMDVLACKAVVAAVAKRAAVERLPDHVSN